MKKLITSIKTLVRKISVLLSTPPAFLPPHCCNISALLMHLCDNDQELHRYVLRWIAFPLRTPGAKMSTALLVNGGQGTGKSMFFDQVVGTLYGPRARHIDGSQLPGRFNDWASNALYVTIDGRFSVRSTSTLKALITSTDLLITRRLQLAQRQPNKMNFVFLSGAADFLPIDATDRRFCVIEAPPAASSRFYRAVVDEISNGGVDAFFHYLMSELDMGDFNEYTAPPGHTSGQLNAVRANAHQAMEAA